MHRGRAVRQRPQLDAPGVEPQLARAPSLRGRLRRGRLPTSGELAQPHLRHLRIHRPQGPRLQERRQLLNRRVDGIAPPTGSPGSGVKGTSLPHQGGGTNRQRAAVLLDDARLPVDLLRARVGHRGHRGAPEATRAVCPQASRHRPGHQIGARRTRVASPTGVAPPGTKGGATSSTRNGRCAPNSTAFTFATGIACANPFTFATKSPKRPTVCCNLRTTATPQRPPPDAGVAHQGVCGNAPAGPPPQRPRPAAALPRRRLSRTAWHSPGPLEYARDKKSVAPARLRIRADTHADADHRTTEA